MTVAVPAVVICINRRLYLLASPTSILPSETDKRREIIIDLAIGIGLPIMIMILCPFFSITFQVMSLWLIHITAFFAQGSRFSIVEDYGCSPAILRTWVAVVIINAPPVLLELIASVYGCLSIHAFYKRRSRLNESLSSHRGLNSNRYLRLMAFSVCDLLAGIPISAFYVYLEFKSPRLFRFPGLTQEHYQFSQIIQVPAVLWRANAKSEVGYELSRWIMVVAAFVSFAIFGFTREARDKYRVVLQAIVHVFTAITGIKTCKRPSNRAEGCVTFSSSPSDILNMLLLELHSRLRLPIGL